MLLAGTVNAAVFNSWMETLLLPKQHQPIVMIMDNAAFHKHPTTRALIEAAGHILRYLPPYSPDHNSIKQRWAKLKAIRRRTCLGSS